MKTRYYVIFAVIGVVAIFPVISIVFYGAVPVGINTRYFENCEDCELYGCADNEIYDHGICMTPKTKERAESIGEPEQLTMDEMIEAFTKTYNYVQENTNHVVTEREYYGVMRLASSDPDKAIEIFNDPDYPHKFFDETGYLPDEIPEEMYPIVLKRSIDTFSYIKENTNREFTRDEYSSVMRLSNGDPIKAVAIFNKDGKSIIDDSINVKSYENNYHVSYTILDGFLHDMEYDDSFDSLTFKIRSIDNGELYMFIPKAVFEDRSDKQFVNIMILENMEEVDFIDTSDSDNYKLKLNFTNSNPVIEIIQTYVP